MKIGDRVRFLNSVGGGIVVKFKDKNIILVEDTDGFEIPVLITECVVVGTTENNSSSNREHSNKNSASKLVDKESDIQIINNLKIEETRDGDQLNVYLGFLSTDLKNLSFSNIEYFLINDSNYFLDYIISKKESDGQWILQSKSTIDPNTKLFISEVNRSDIDSLSKLCVQFIAYKSHKSFMLKNTYSVDLKIDSVKFYKLHSFKDNDFFEEPAIMYPLVRRDVEEKRLSISSEELEKSINEKMRDDSQKVKQTSRTNLIKEKNGILEIDLHINELLDSTIGLPPADILEYQLNKFREIMNENKYNRGKKIVFIHGKGNGVLKNALVKDIKNRYKTVFYQDASFREYGFGATMVTIK